MRAQDDNVSALAAIHTSPKPWVELLSWKPRAFLYHNFVSPAECQHIIQEAKPMMRRSTVIGEAGSSIQDSIRTSYGTFLLRRHDSAIARMEDRLAAWTQLPMTHQEDLQVLRYSQGEKYGPHYDSVQGEALKGRSPRIATVIVYLNEDATLQGGETAFTQAPGIGGIKGLSACADGFVAVKPRRGDALLFYTLKPDSSQDDASIHTGCPVLQGVKWTATKWIHTEPFHPEWLSEKMDTSNALLPENCTDTELACPAWAASGECSKNREYMVGDDVVLGQCRASCQECEPCASSDRACHMRNRARAGFLALPDGED
ncbi:hypothetical protein CVIRNUC_002078 [Coccomyxa viridis]|uniref:Procollagen-proline 4-dioxygenase n=1 Tax=Coccomyxa viridis TaxID=1274662 RepID=A0AAV1HVV7_9CHLO|nr:hypothetical protein CVIRNUC_002078 [Coccomyxa viridis]